MVCSEKGWCSKRWACLFSVFEWHTPVRRTRRERRCTYLFVLLSIAWTNTTIVTFFMNNEITSLTLKSFVRKTPVWNNGFFSHDSFACISRPTRAIRCISNKTWVFWRFSRWTCDRSVYEHFGNVQRSVDHGDVAVAENLFESMDLKGEERQWRTSDGLNRDLCNKWWSLLEIWDWSWTERNSCRLSKRKKTLCYWMSTSIGQFLKRFEVGFEIVNSSFVYDSNGDVPFNIDE